MRSVFSQFLALLVIVAPVLVCRLYRLDMRADFILHSTGLIIVQVVSCLKTVAHHRNSFIMVAERSWSARWRKTGLVWLAPRSRHLSTATPEEAMRAMQQQFTSALDSLTRQNVDLQAELARNRQQAASELETLRQELRAPQRATSPTVGVDTRLLGKPGVFSGAQEAWRDWSAVFRGYAGAAVPRLQKLMGEAAKATSPVPNVTILKEEDRAASAQLYWMMLMICKGAAKNIVFLAGDNEGLEAWPLLTEKYEPKMRTRYAKTTDVHSVVLTPREHGRANHSLGT